MRRSAPLIWGILAVLLLALAACGRATRKAVYTLTARPYSLLGKLSRIPASLLTVQCELKEGKGGLWLMLVEMRDLLSLVP